MGGAHSHLGSPLGRQCDGRPTVPIAPIIPVLLSSLNILPQRVFRIAVKFKPLEFLSGFLRSQALLVMGHVGPAVDSHAIRSLNHSATARYPRSSSET